MERFTPSALSLEDQVTRRLWPEEARGSFYWDVLELADSAAISGSQPNAIAAILLYQQLVEEIFHLIDYWCYFEMALAIHPTSYAYNAPDRAMFGQLLDRVRKSQDFPGKTVLLQNAQELNSQCRIPAAHKLLHGDTLTQIEVTGETSRLLFRSILDEFNSIRDHFYGRFDMLAVRTGLPLRWQ